MYDPTWKYYDVLKGVDALHHSEKGICIIDGDRADLPVIDA